MKAILIALSLVALCVAVLPRASIYARQEAEFRNWMSTHGKTYSQEEYPSRFIKYQETSKRIAKLNSESQGGATFAHNKFSDLSPEEFKAIYLTARPGTARKQGAPVEVLEPLGQAPAAFDWRSKKAVTAVKDQGQCGSCWAFSATENVESVWMLKHNLTSTDMIPLAPQQIVDCDTADDGCNGGDTITAFQYLIKAGGQEPNKDYPYTAEDGTCQFKAADIFSKISTYKYATDPNKINEATMMANCYSWAPLSICVDAASWQNYAGGVMKYTQCGRNLDHCVQAVGYDTTASVPFWSVRNSWSSTWGENGYIRLQYGHDTCGLADEATTAVSQ